MRYYRYSIDGKSSGQTIAPISFDISQVFLYILNDNISWQEARPLDRTLSDCFPTDNMKATKAIHPGRGAALVAFLVFRGLASVAGWKTE